MIQFNNRELRFSLVDGDFKKFEGKWCVNSENRSLSTVLSYEVNVIPRFNLPTIFLERIIGSDLPVNLRALACRAETLFWGNQKMPLTESSLHATSSTYTSGVNLDFKKDNSSLAGSKSSATSNFGSLHRSFSELGTQWGIFQKVCSLDRRCMVDEVHLRRFDGLLENGGVHCCVSASITVKAPVNEVWNALTAYEKLPEVVPNLAISRVISRQNNRVTILQEGCKGLLYMMLHARVLLDLCEYFHEEITFEQVEGDFDEFHGKWHLKQLGNRHTVLKYSVESKMNDDSFLSEAIMEEVIYEDFPSNLCAIRDYVEKSEAAFLIKTFNDKNNSKDQEISPGISKEKSIPSRRRPRVSGLQSDIEVLKAELLAFISEHGQEGFMPLRKQLRKHGRLDIEKAISHMGGFRRIATLMNLSLAYKHRKPKGFWDSFENLQEEILQFQKSWGMDLSFMPSRKSFEQAGRYDIARALEKWGGLHEVARLLSLKLRHPYRQLTKDEENETSHG